MLFYDDGHLVIADMGITIDQKMVNGVEVPVEHNREGTWAYMSPEQVVFLFQQIMNISCV